MLMYLFPLFTTAVQYSSILSQLNFFPRRTTAVQYYYILPLIVSSLYNCCTVQFSDFRPKLTISSPFLKNKFVFKNLYKNFNREYEKKDPGVKPTQFAEE